MQTDLKFHWTHFYVLSANYEHLNVFTCIMLMMLTLLDLITLTMFGTPQLLIGR